jgi:ACS family hexuronate transporter-like MFS transporter
LRNHAKWFLCGLLFLATLLNYLDRQTMSVASTKIAEEMDLTDTDLGRLFFAFYLSYGIAQVFIGGFLDRLTVGLAYALAVTAWSLSGAAAALAVGFWSLFFLRVLLGVCESPNWPLALRVVARTFPPGQRAFATGTFQCGTSVGALVAPPVIIFLTAQYNWRVAFVVCGVVGLGWVVLWLLWFRGPLATSIDHGNPVADLQQDPAPEREAASASTAPSRFFRGNVQKLPETAFVQATSPSIRGYSHLSLKEPQSPATLSQILCSRALWGMFLSTCFLNPLQYLYFSWLPRYFQHYAGVAFGKELSNRLVLAYLAYDAGLLLAGGLVVWLAPSWGVVRARLAVCAACTLCMMSIPAVSGLDDLDAITAIICVATFGLGGCIVSYLAFTAEVSAQKVSTAAGILGGAGSLAGAGFMLLVGDLVDRSGGFTFVFAMAGVMPLVSLAGMWFSTGPTRATAEVAKRHVGSEE